MMMVMVVRSKVLAEEEEYGEADGDGQEPVGFTDRCSYHKDDEGSRSCEVSEVLSPACVSR